MLSDREKHCCKQILDLLTDEDILSLVGTSTNYTIKADSRTDAENAILAFTVSPEDLLIRRKITRGLLMKYCLSAQIPASAYDSKHVLVGLIIKHWAQTSVVPSAPAYQHGPHVSLGRENHKNHNESSNYQQAPVLPACGERVTIVQNFVNIHAVHEAYNQTYNFSNVASLGDADQANAEAFVKWFYEMLNAYHPAVNKPAESFGPHHFWDDAQLYLLMVTSAQKEEESIVGSDKVAERLLAFTKSSHILFNPNVNSQGVTLRTKHHGSKLILVCGTLHRANECFGIFQQSFALVSNPLSPGNWKVKITCLKMDQCFISTLPKLEDCQEIQAIEAHTTLALERSQVDEPSHREFSGTSATMFPS